MQSNSVASAFDNAFHIDSVVTAAVVVVLLALVVVGGVKRIAKFASVVTPFMALGYIGISLVIVVMNWRALPDVLALIFKSAFGFGPVFGGMLGRAVSMGVKRGLFSNEAGNAVVMNAPELGANYVAFTQASIDSVLHGVGGPFVSIALAFFVFTTLVAYYLYAESSIFYLFKKNRSSKFKKVVIWVYRLVFFAMIILGSSLTADYVWTLGDIGVGLTTWVNIIALLMICPEAIKCLKEYEAVLKTD